MPCRKKKKSCENKYINGRQGCLLMVASFLSLKCGEFFTNTSKVSAHSCFTHGVDVRAERNKETYFPPSVNWLPFRLCTSCSLALTRFTQS